MYIEKARLNLANINEKTIAFSDEVGYTEFIIVGGYDTMKHALNATDIKRANQRLILDAIFQSGTTSRTQLAKDLQLSKPAISDNLQYLLDVGIVEENGVGRAGPSGGRKSILLRFNSSNRLIIAVNLNFSTPLFALTDLNGKILRSFDITIAPGTPIDACRDLVLEGIRTLLQSPGAGQEIVYCIALATPGVFNEDGKLLHFSTSCGGPQWWLMDLKQIVTEAFSLPVIIYNDVKAATLGEWIRGTGNRENNLLYLHAGLGIGSGIILNGKPLLGENFSAGELYDYFDPADANSGRKLEDTVCIDYLKKECTQREDSPFAGKDQVPLEEIIRAYSAGNSAVASVVEDICGRLAVLSYNYMSFISINRIVFGGDYVPFGDCFANHLLNLFERSQRPAPDIRMSDLGKFAGIQGMIFLARDRYFQEICTQ